MLNLLKRALGLAGASNPRTARHLEEGLRRGITEILRTQSGDYNAGILAKKLRERGYTVLFDDPGREHLSYLTVVNLRERFTIVLSRTGKFTLSKDK